MALKGLEDWRQRQSLLLISIPEGPYTLPMELGTKKNHPYFGFGDLIP